MAATWSLSFTFIEQRSPVAADLLRLCKVIYPDAIPEDLFLPATTHPGSALSLIDANPLMLNQALAIIQSYSPKPPQEALSFEVGEECGAPLIGLANLYRDQGRYEEAEAHYLHALQIREQQRGAEHLETAEILADFARFYERRNQSEMALKLYQRVLPIRERCLGPQHPLLRCKSSRAVPTCTSIDMLILHNRHARLSGQ